MGALKVCVCFGRDRVGKEKRHVFNRVKEFESELLTLVFSPYSCLLCSHSCWGLALIREI